MLFAVAYFKLISLETCKYYLIIWICCRKCSQGEIFSSFFDSYEFEKALNIRSNWEKAEFRANPSLFFGRWKKYLWKKLIRKDFKGDLTDEKGPFFLQIAERIIRRKIGLWLGRKIWPPPPFPLIGKEMLPNFVCLCSCNY